MDADLVLDRDAGHIIGRTGLAVRIQMKFRDDEQRNAAGSLRRTRCAGQYQMDDIVGQIMFAKGDVDFLTPDPVFSGMFAFGDRFRG